mgnify:CR=1 FL=1
MYVDLICLASSYNIEHDYILVQCMLCVQYIGNDDHSSLFGVLLTHLCCFHLTLGKVIYT